MLTGLMMSGEAAYVMPSGAISSGICGGLLSCQTSVFCLLIKYLSVFSHLNPLFSIIFDLFQLILALTGSLGCLVYHRLLRFNDRNIV